MKKLLYVGAIVMVATTATAQAAETVQTYCVRPRNQHHARNRR
jgi:hypothetical protein